jgi:hypothetical protein
MSGSLHLQPQVLSSRAIMIEAQDDFLRRGGGYQLGLTQLRMAGIIGREYVYHEYPKAITIRNGPEREVMRETISCDKEKIRWTEMVPDETTIIVSSEEEEERVLAGGKTSVQIEEDRQGLLAKARSMGLRADPAWSAVRLRKELGETMDTPPADNVARLEAELAHLRKIEALQAEIAELKARQAVEPDQSPIEELGDTRKGKRA